MIQRTLGHTSTTLDTHGHLLEALDEAAASRLEEAGRAAVSGSPADTSRTLVPGRVVALPRR